MPKMKSLSVAMKRFSLTSTGKVKFKHAKMRHILEKRPKQTKRKLRHTGILVEADAKHIRTMLGHG